MTATPLTVRRTATMARIRRADLSVRQIRDRRQRAAAAGYHGPLTREELARTAR